MLGGMLNKPRGPDELEEMPSMFVKHPSEWQRHPSPFVGHRFEDVGMLTEERRKLSVFVGKPEIQREMPSSFEGML
jgi:hypothetical protein